MTEYIKRESAIEAIMSDPPDAHYPHWYADKIKAIPAADVEPVKRGRWVHKVLLGEQAWFCSECKTIGSPQWKRCPVCEAKMIEEVKHENRD